MEGDKKTQVINENVNIKVEKKQRKSIIPLLLVFILIFVCLIVYYIFFKEDKEESINKNDIKEEVVENSKENKENIIDETEEIIDENVQDKVEENENQISSELQKVYNKYESANWSSKLESEKINLFEVKNGKICYTNGSIKNQEVAFEHGIPKYLKTYINGGILQNLYVITEEKEAYVIDIPEEFWNNENYMKQILSQGLDCEQIEFDEKIVDMMTSVKNVDITYYGPYFLTESGKILTKDKKTYEEVNRKHIEMIGSIFQIVYLNEDKTLEVQRSSKSNEYMYVIDEIGEEVKVKYAFTEISSRWNGTTSNHYYLVDENNNLLHFSSESLFVAQQYYGAEGKKVRKLEYTDNDRNMKIIFEDGSHIVIEECQDYIKSN